MFFLAALVMADAAARRAATPDLLTRRQAPQRLVRVGLRGCRGGAGAGRGIGRRTQAPHRHSGGAPCPARTRAAALAGAQRPPV